MPIFWATDYIYSFLILIKLINIYICPIKVIIKAQFNLPSSNPLPIINPNPTQPCNHLYHPLNPRRPSSWDCVSCNASLRPKGTSKSTNESSANRLPLYSCGHTLTATGVYFLSYFKTWPVVDVLFQSHTSDFPYIMVYEYVQKHKPFLVNDINN